MWTLWPTSAPAELALNVTPSGPLFAPDAIGARLLAVRPAPPSRESVMLPPFTLVWMAVRTCGLAPAVPL